MTRYEVLERIGAGRMAELFRGKAIAAGGFEKPVAIKRILPHLSSDPRFVELLIAEAKILSVLRHRNIVQIFDVGVGDDGHHFLVMEFVDGVDLGALQRNLEGARRRLPIDLVLHVGAEVCEALEHAQHAAGPDGAPMRLVHRDVTPANVLVSRAGEVKLTDFGLAKRPEDGTSAGGLRGRFGYVSPEQASGLPVDARSDVFAVGVMMWELALGRRLFSGLPDFEALRAVRENPIPRLRELDPSLPPDLDTILAEALARDPDHRLPGAGELGKRLRGLRYSLDDSSGDPAAALGRLVVGVERGPAAAVIEKSTTARGKKRPTSGGFDGAEPTVLRIRTADGFADDQEGTSLSRARRVIDSFEEEQTRMSRLPAAFEEISTVGGSMRARSQHDARVDTPPGMAPLHLRDSGEISATHPAQAPLHLRDSGELAAAPPPDLDDPPLEERRRGRPARASRTPPPVPVRPAAPPPPPPASSSSPELRAAAARAAAAPPPAPPMPAPMPAPPMPAPPSAASSSPSLRAPTEPATAAPYPQRPATSAPYPLGAAPAHVRSATSRPVVGFGRRAPRRWWPIVVAAIAIAALSFLITRAALDPGELPTGTPGAADAGAAGDATAATDDAAATPAVATPPDAGLDAPEILVDAADAPDDAGLDDATAPDDATPASDATPLDDAGPDDALAAAPVDAAPTAKPTPPRKKPVRKPPRKKPIRKPTRRGR